MLKKNNKERAISELRKNKIESIFNIIPNLSDKTLDYVEEKYKISNLINETFDSKKNTILIFRQHYFYYLECKLE